MIFPRKTYATLKKAYNIYLRKLKDFCKLKNKNFLTKIEDIREEKEDIQEVNCFYCVFNGLNKLNEKIIRIKEEIESYFSSYFKSVYPYAKFSLKLISSEDLYLFDIKRKQSLKNTVIELAYFGDKTISSEVETEKVKGRLATARGKDIANLVKNMGMRYLKKCKGLDEF